VAGADRWSNKFDIKLASPFWRKLMSQRNWITTSVCAVVVSAFGLTAQAHPGGLDTPSPDIPPVIVPGVYLSPNNVHALYSGPGLQIVLSMAEHQPFAALPPRYENCQPGSLVCDEHHTFNSTLEAMVSVNGSPPQGINMNGPVQTVAFLKGPTDTTGTFDTEMLAMNLVGTVMGNPVMIRESPTKASSGKTSITDLSGPGPPGPYHIDSFFDVFTEISLDGGQSWIPKAGTRGTRVTLGGVPEPSSALLAALAFIGAAGISRRRVTSL
jgi:hypothetical protein